MHPTIELLIDDFHERDLPRVVLREQSAPVMAGKATVVVGMRRSGKTWFCYQRMQELMARHREGSPGLYNFEDERSF
jgi:predicted AAA+ superfamily ATPase